MNTVDTIYDFNIHLFAKADVEYQEWIHEPILDFATDERVAVELGWTGTHTKSLFLKSKNGPFTLYLTEKDSRLDSKAIKNITGRRVSICKDEEMVEQTGCVPGAVCPFGLPDSVELVIDKTLLECTELLFTPGKPEFTFAFKGSDLKTLLDALPNRVYYLD
ncbi:YbaK/EbsC family protein [Vibrio maerlii]|uniref:YbaK/EbsC family protein n=1 Tax=Vibrio maerlii TaxID=2231648 RepID=UPI000E3D2F0D|nr:YbaK/EbsC family protein [Vibrio maerlii]